MRSIVRAVIGVIPWGVALIAIVIFSSWLGPSGILYALGWTLAVVVYRGAAGGQSRSGRMRIDALAGVVCILTVYLGGWYLLPAVIAFGLVDLSALGSPTPRFRAGGTTEVLAATATVFANIVALLVLTTAGIYSSTSSSVAADGTVTNAPSQTIGFVATNGTRGVAIMALIILFTVAVGAGSLVHFGLDRRVGHVLVGVGALGLLILTLAGALSIGIWLFPGSILAFATWLAGRHPSERSARDHSPAS